MATKKNKRISAEESNLSPSVKKLRGHTKASGTTDEGIQRTRPTDGSSSSDDILCSTSMSTVLYTMSDDYLRCLACHNAIMLSDRGHSFYTPCYPPLPLAERSFCKMPMNDAPHATIESVLEKFTLPCRYSLNGCNYKPMHFERSEHEKNCVFRTFDCFRCNQECRLQDFENHCIVCLRSIAPLPSTRYKLFIDGNGQLLKICQDIIRFTYKEDSKNYFSLRRVEEVGTFLRRMVKRNGTWNFWISIDKPETQIATLRHDLVTVAQNKNFKLTYSGPVFSILVPEEEILESGKCFSIPEKNIKRLVNSNGKILMMSDIIIPKN